MSQSVIAATTRQVKTMADGTLRISLDVEPGDAADAFALFGSPGVAAAIARLTDDASRGRLAQRAIDQDTGRYGAQARILFQSSFFRSPVVWRAVGTDDEFLAWLRTQPCAKTGQQSSESDPVVAAHVRRVSEGAGMGIKPPYCAIPLLDSLHRLQHQKGESAVAVREWWESQRIVHVHRWAWEALKSKLGFESWRDVPPETMIAWARAHDLANLLPYEYLGAEHA